MAEAFQLSVVAPDKTIVDEVTESVIAPGLNGYFGVHSGHEPFVTQLRPGIVTYKDAGGAEQRVAISGGFAEVSADHVILLADSAERQADIDVSRAENAADRARNRLSDRTAEIDAARAQAALERAENRLRLGR